MPFSSPFLPGGGASSASSSDLVLSIGGTWLQDTGAEVDSINRATASQAGHTLIEPRVFEINFQAGWPSDVVVRINGKSRSGATINEDFAPPGADAGGLVKGSKVFCEHTTTTISSPSAGVHNASIRYRDVAVAPCAPVKAFLFFWKSAAVEAISTYSLSEGWVQAAAPFAGGDVFYVLYSHEPTVTLT